MNYRKRKRDLMVLVKEVINGWKECGWSFVERIMKEGIEIIDIKVIVNIEVRIRKWSKIGNIERKRIG